MPRILRSLADLVRNGVVDRTTSLFAHAPDPLEQTLSYEGDPGLFGPESITWPVLGDVAAFVGGLRALLVQAAHPEVVAGVSDHSRYSTDPLGRLSRTSAYVAATSFGAMPEVDAAVEFVAGAHRGVSGRSHRGRGYSAAKPELAAWVHNTLTHSFLVSYQEYGPRPLSDDDADRFVSEQQRVGRLLGADPLPGTAVELDRWIRVHPDIGPSPGQKAAIDFLTRPPLPLLVRLGYMPLMWAAATTVPSEIRDVVGVRVPPGGRVVGRAVVVFLRWSLGSSPSWRAALVRSGATVPEGIFRSRQQPARSRPPRAPRRPDAPRELVPHP